MFCKHLNHFKTFLMFTGSLHYFSRLCCWLDPPGEGNSCSYFLSLYPRIRLKYLQIRLKVHDNPHFSSNFWSLSKMCLHNTCAKRKRCYDVTLSIHEGSKMPGKCTVLDWRFNGKTGWPFLSFGGPVCSDRISNCPLDRMY